MAGTRDRLLLPCSFCLPTWPHHITRPVQSTSAISLNQFLDHRTRFLPSGGRDRERVAKESHPRTETYGHKKTKMPGAACAAAWRFARVAAAPSAPRIPRPPPPCLPLPASCKIREINSKLSGRDDTSYVRCGAGCCSDPSIDGQPASGCIGSPARRLLDDPPWRPSTRPCEERGGVLDKEWIPFSPSYLLAYQASSAIGGTTMLHCSTDARAWVMDVTPCRAASAMLALLVET